MTKKNPMDALSDISIMVRKKLENSHGFTAFIITYSAGGNYMTQIEPGTTEQERTIAFSRMVSWVKSQSSYMCVFGIHNSETREALIIAKTREEMYHLTLNYTVRDGQYIFAENSTNESNTEYDNYINKIYQIERSVPCQRNQLPN